MPLIMDCTAGSGASDHGNRISNNKKGQGFFYSAVQQISVRFYLGPEAFICVCVPQWAPLLWKMCQPPQTLFFQPQMHLSGQAKVDVLVKRVGFQEWRTCKQVNCFQLGSRPWLISITLFYKETLFLGCCCYGGGGGGGGRLVLRVSDLFQWVEASELAILDVLCDKLWRAEYHLATSWHQIQYCCSNISECVCMRACFICVCAHMFLSHKLCS